jgi:hypothetical protein
VVQAGGIDVGIDEWDGRKGRGMELQLLPNFDRSVNVNTVSEGTCTRTGCTKIIREADFKIRGWRSSDKLKTDSLLYVVGESLPS